MRMRHPVLLVVAQPSDNYSISSKLNRRVYLSDTPEKRSSVNRIIETMFNTYDDLRTERYFLLGFGLSGFWAIYFGHYLSIPFVAVNPIRMPSRDIDDESYKKIENVPALNDNTGILWNMIPGLIIHGSSPATIESNLWRLALPSKQHIFLPDMTNPFEQQNKFINFIDQFVNNLS